MARTTETAVKGVLLSDYGPRSDGTDPSLLPFIAAAGALVSRVAICATAKGVSLSTAEQELIERWLAAHFYVASDQKYASKSTGGAGGSFQGQTAMALDYSPYGQTAKLLDYSGCLGAISNRQTAGAFWLGKAPSEQTTYRDRD